MVTDLPHPGSERAREEGALAAAGLAEVVRLYGLRMWVEQSYKQVKHALGWGQYQVRSDLAIRRHWQLVICAFSFCWWASSSSEFLEVAETPGEVASAPKENGINIITPTTDKARRGEKKAGEERTLPIWPKALRKVRGWLEPYIMVWRYWKAYSDRPPPKELGEPLERVFSGKGLYLYVR